MEIRFDNPKKELTFTIKEKEINGVIGNNKEELANLLLIKNGQSNKIYINQELIKKDDINTYKEKIKIIPEEMDPFQFRFKVYECMYLEIQRNKLSLKDPKKKILDSLKIVGLNITYLNRNIQDLSTSERKQLQLGLTLMTNPEVIIMVEPFKNFDLKTERRIFSFLQVIKEQYGKTIVIVSDDTDMLYRYAEHLIILKNNKTLIEGPAKEILEKVVYLNQHNITIPEIVEFTYLANNKQAKIDYHKDIRDLIKDIYKHV